MLYANNLSNKETADCLAKLESVINEDIEHTRINSPAEKTVSHINKLIFDAFCYKYRNNNVKAALNLLKSQNGFKRVSSKSNIKSDKVVEATETDKNADYTLTIKYISGAPTELTLTIN